MLNKDGNIIYIGKAKNLKNRLSSYFDSSVKSSRIKLMISDIDSIEVTTTLSENDALVLEQKLINKIKPKYNIIFRDDKSYPFISLSKHTFPKIYISREKNSHLKKENLFGPYPKSDDAYKNIEYIQKIFQLRTCTDNEFSHRTRPCMLHSIGKCCAPCINKDNILFREEYDYSITQAKKILKGQISSTLHSLHEKMNTYSEKMEYEKAAHIRDTIQALKDLRQSQSIFSTKQENAIVFNFIIGEKILLGYTRILDGVPQEIFNREIQGEMKEYSIEELLTRYIESVINPTDSIKIITPIELPELLYPYQFQHTQHLYKEWLKLVENNLIVTMNEQVRVATQHRNTYQELKKIFIPYIASLDCIDISHFNGEATYGGKVRWSYDPIDQTGSFDTPFYRLARFPSQFVDDIKHIRETVSRIYHNDNDFPSILIIDGDKPQLEAAYEGLKNKQIEKNYILMSSAKGASRKKGQEIFYVHPTSLHLIHSKYLSGDTLSIPKDSLVRLLIQKIQDSAHDFSNNARKKQMSKTRFS